MKGNVDAADPGQDQARPHLTTPADPPSINRKIARIWFPESQPPATGSPPIAISYGRHDIVKWVAPAWAGSVPCASCTSARIRRDRGADRTDAGGQPATALQQERFPLVRVRLPEAVQARRMRSTLLAAVCRADWSQMWSHSPGFAGVRGDPSVTVSAGHGRSRTSVNAGQHYWKACGCRPGSPPGGPARRAPVLCPILGAEWERRSSVSCVQTRSTKPTGGR
jgi:hypothetical protein